MAVDYNHSRNLHTLDGPKAAVHSFFAGSKPLSLLDVGCGTGTWLRAAMEAGVPDVYGLDGIDIPAERLQFPAERFERQDLTSRWSLGRRFEAVFCLEVAEHLTEEHGASLIDALVAHGDLIYFSAACPGQDGQHHVNCQWPAYWQRLFNERGFACSDLVRWQIWSDARIEPWYRQNLFVATRDVGTAGLEPRIANAIHPDMLGFLELSSAARYAKLSTSQIECGSKQISWYVKTPFQAVFAKMIRFLRRFRPSHDSGSEK